MFFLKLVQAKLLSLQNKANWENWAEYHEIYIVHQIQSVGMSWLQNALFVIFNQTGKFLSAKI